MDIDKIDSAKVDAITVYCDECLGIYIPKNFAESVVRNKLMGVDPDDLEVLSEGPENEMYWDSWHTVLHEAFFLDENGDVYELYQDGSLFVICIARMTDQEYLDFFGEPRE